MSHAKVTLIVGAGDATGGAIARRFAREGHVVCLTRRTQAKLDPLVRQIEQQGGRALAGFLNGREAATRMVPRQRGTILFTGATASVRGAAGYAAFAGGKAALRGLAQSMAREPGPEGIHVAHVVVDGAIDTEFTPSRAPERYAARKDSGGILNLESIAENYWMLHAQPRDAWTHELDPRPWSETW